MKYKNKNILITGISGFVGSYLAEHLIKSEANIFGLVRWRADGDTPRHIRKHGLGENVTLLSGDLLDQGSLTNVIRQSRPDIVFHLAAQSFVPRSFSYPGETYSTNTTGTMNLLEAIRNQNIATKFIFAGSSEEYGLVYSNEKQYSDFIKEKGNLFPKPEKIPELPINENNPLRPMSPYALSKVQGDYMVRSYFMCSKIPTIVSRAFNHEGAGRGSMFVSSVIAKQVTQINNKGIQKGIEIGNVNSFRDWSHVQDIVKGYCLLADKGIPGEIYNQGSQRTDSILTYILLAIKEINLNPTKIETFKNGKSVIDPLEIDNSKIFNIHFNKTKLDALMLNQEINFDLSDEGIWITTEKGKIPVYFNPNRFRSLEVPILLSDTTKINKLGFKVENDLSDIIKDQIHYYLEN